MSSLIPNKLNRSLAVFLLSLGVAIGLFSSAQSQEIFSDCRSDIGNFCSDISPENGRILSCLYAHQDKITPLCNDSLTVVKNSLDFIFDSLEETFTNCGNEIAEFCADKKFGYGRILSCLTENQSNLSGSCRAYVTEFQMGISPR